MTPTIVVIAGGTGAGKSTLAQALCAALADQAALIGQDAYYHDLAHRPAHERATVNFDHPDAMDFDLIRTHLAALRGGDSIEIPTYDFTTHTRRPETLRIPPAPVVVFEGILALHPEWIEDLTDLRVFVETPEELRLHRRITRDVAERGRDSENVIRQFIHHATPMHESYVEPTRPKAHLIVSGEAPPTDNVAAIVSRMPPNS